ncbi:ABC transporter ATP-binding protein [uncultured Clostridium sp.]|uniref:energy-coupling factor ABC transporter ATP-binding protein n=1 Tax=uncultured Clostridium sp. TaxID=59620 RepID=UPI0028E6CA57|nr:ABC transporter ATP-binding protein [uncultured Clostridium sp.]
MNIVSLKNISYQYPLEDREVIKNVSLDIKKGKVYGLIGANESGKTSLCNIIRGFIPELYRGKLKGEVLIHGKKIEEYSMGDLSTIIGYSFQNPFTQISGVKDTVYEEIAYGMENIGVPRDKMIDRVNELIKLFNLEKLVDKNPYELSGGQKQRVALASMLALDPEIIIMDEPTSQLDPKGTEDIFEIIQFMKNKGKTIILVEHKIDLIASYCDNILLMNNGKLVMNGTVREILTNTKVLEYGGQLPQVVLYFIERIKRGEDFDFIPLTVEEAYEYLEKRGVK